MSEIKSTDWKTWMLGVLLMLTVAFGGSTWVGTTSRLDALETKQEKRVEKDEAIAVDIALIKVSQSELKTAMDKLQRNQEEDLKQTREFVNDMKKNSKRWNEMMDSIEAQNKKKK